MKKVVLSLIIFSFLSLGSLKAQFTNKGYVVINGSFSLVVKNLDFVNEGTVEMKGNGKLYMRGGANGGDLINNGTFGDNTLSETYQVIFDGDADQAIKGSNEPFFDQLITAQTGTVSVTQEIDATANKIKVGDAGNLFDYRVKDPSNSGLRLSVDHFDLTGNLRLYDDSQILPTSDNASFSATGVGNLYRDQLGTGNKYWYNYWCAPVNMHDNDSNWQVDLLMDGRDPENPQPINFVYEHDADGSNQVNSGQNPAYLNEAWIWVFRNTGNDYANWVYVGSTGNIKPGEGYSMKGPNIFNAPRPGSSGNTEFKAYTFAGEPNGGSYNLTLSAGNMYLVGNPFASAMDADAFINEHQNIITGDLYFWEHISGQDHYLHNYVGGYATYNLSGATPASDWQNNGATGTKIPGQYIPVAQGFFVEAQNGGTLTFKNSQREFVKEDGSNSVFMRSNLTDIRLYYTNPDGLRRHLLLAIRPNTTMDDDWGWDAKAADNNTNFGGDMFFKIGNNDYVIQAIPEITEETRLPLHITTNTDGQVEIGLTELMNVPSDMEIFIEDSQEAQTYPISLTSPFTTNLPTGDFTDRFFLVFRPSSTMSADEDLISDIKVYYNDNYVIIKNPRSQQIDKVDIFDMQGKLVISKAFNSKEQMLKLPVQATTGVYLFNVHSGNAVKGGKFIVE